LTERSPDMSELWSRVGQLSVEVKSHRTKLDELSTQQDKTSATTDKLVADVGRIESQISDLAEMRSTLEQAGTELKEHKEKLNELETQQTATTKSVERLHVDVNNIQSEVFFVFNIFFLPKYSFIADGMHATYRR